MHYLGFLFLNSKFVKLTDKILHVTVFQILSKLLLRVIYKYSYLYIYVRDQLFGSLNDKVNSNTKGHSINVRKTLYPWLPAIMAIY